MARTATGGFSSRILYTYLGDNSWSWLVRPQRNVYSECSYTPTDHSTAWGGAGYVVAPDRWITKVTVRPRVGGTRGPNSALHILMSASTCFVWQFTNGATGLKEPVVRLKGLGFAAETASHRPKIGLW